MIEKRVRIGNGFVDISSIRKHEQSRAEKRGERRSFSVGLCWFMSVGTDNHETRNQVYA
jgi:hypothetical protein